MAKGYPDYFGQSIWPKYGTMFRQGVISPVIIPGATGDIFSLSRKAIAYGGVIECLGLNVDVFDIVVRVQIDGSLIIQRTPNNMMDYGETGESLSPVTLSVYNKTELRFSLQVQRDISFMTNFRIYLTNTSVANLGFGGGLYYYTQV